MRILKFLNPKIYNQFLNKSSNPNKFSKDTSRVFFSKIDLNDREAGVCELLKNKIVLVGYLGPGNENKQYTPIRTHEQDIAGVPDTHDMVIQANAIRTILEYQKK